MNSESRLIAQIKSGDQKAAEKIYNQYRKEFLVYASRLSISDEDAADIYQDSMVTLYENIVSGKLTTLTSSIKTYLFAIGKHKIYSRLKLKDSEANLEEYGFLFQEKGDEEFLLREESIEKLQKGYRELGDKCRKVLKLFYYENRSIEEIKVSLGYTSKDVVKSQKSRCIKQLREILLKLK